MNFRIPLSALAAVVFVLLDCSVTVKTSAAADSETTAWAVNCDSLTILAQYDDDRSGSSVRLRGRSIRGLISLVVLGIAGVGWVFKKLFGGGDDGG